ncbi:transporter [Adhaeribacter rhizoryzae]|uniref:Transporter n=1 Tax=Adhaeribacter rhizoryzae TaxID=2607907 RepID=A0A5M6CUA2_9BACT|nr:transporter [Adhaeribacter rhizoryzae]KAA5538838.1 transporter [Adhaeribacter rhizoryzae]
MKKLVAVCLVFLYGPIYSFAQNGNLPELESDRPTRSQGAAVVPMGTLQIESGLELLKAHDEFGDQKEYLDPTTLIRIGILKNAELRLNADLKKERAHVLSNPGSGNTPEEVKQGFSDIMVGTKVKLFGGKGAIPQVSILGSVTLPFGNKSFRPPHVAPEGRVLFSNKFSEKFEVQYNVGYRKHRDHEAYGGEALYAVTGNLKLTDKFIWFAEVFGQKPKAEEAEHGIDTGLEFKLLPNLQLDIIGAIGLNEQAPDYIVGGGISWRIPR